MGIVVLLGAVVLGSALVGPAVGADGDAPLAEAGLDQQVLRGETVRLDATGSYDPDGRVVEYEWEVRTPGGLTVAPFDPRAPRTTFPATARGRYEVTLTVTDGDGNTGTDTMYVRVGETGIDGDSTDSRGEERQSAAREDPGDGIGRAGVAGTDAAAAACSAGREGLAGGCAAPGGPPDPGPWARIDGPRVVKADHSYTYTAGAGGLSGERSYAWEDGDTGRQHTLVFRSHGEYTARVTVDGAKGRTATDRMDVFVAVEDNERPVVEIVDPGRISAGERVRLSVDASDPDGRIRTTEWSPGRQVRVPTDGSSRTIRVTVTDDDGASVTDSITLSGRAWNRTDVETGESEVTCYYTDERQRDGRNPYSDRCVFEGGNTVSLSTGPSHIEDLEQDPNTDIEWRRTTQERLAELRANDTSKDYGNATESSYDHADLFGYSEDLLTTGIVGQRATVDRGEEFSLDGRTVANDLNGDGEVNAADWDRAYRTTGDLADVDHDADAVGGFKRSIREGADGERDDGDDGSALETAERASARSLDGPFAGTSIDAENRRDRIAALGSRESARSPSGARDGTAPAERDGSTGGPTDGGAPPSEKKADSGGGIDTEGPGSAGDDSSMDDTDSTDSTSTDSTDDTDSTDSTSTGSNGTTGSDTDRGTEGQSRHSPHGGRFVTHP